MVRAYEELSTLRVLQVEVRFLLGIARGSEVQISLDIVSGLAVSHLNGRR